ncbi:MAG: hypothetical protein ONB44_07330 [candidate division KSB1 bacterium]|nr:hypothetical protein [candidate division KSB1 bacterium]MDZ7301938.1 hypothetical protein [candidate division KSB1 bacterium]MDZ7312343.1 hypothetical protein [candidate division KSB1 bacterium]
MENSKPRKKRWLLRIFLTFAILFSLYTWVTLHWSYSTGERTGWVQKFSKKGWICKTWEGELWMDTIPGIVQEKFNFTVRNDSVAAKINRTQGKHVSLTYEQHVGVPTSCFGETEYFVIDVKLLEEYPSLR